MTAFLPCGGLGTGESEFSPEGCSRHSHLVAVFGDGASSDVESTADEDLGDGAVAEGIGFVLLIDDFLDGVDHLGSEHLFSFRIALGAHEESAERIDGSVEERIAAGHSS